MNDLSEQTSLAHLVEKIKKGDQIAFESFYEKTVNRIFGIVYRIVGCQDDAEDVVSEVYAQLWQQAENYSEEKGSVLGWSLLIARSRALDHYRKRKHQFKIQEAVNHDVETNGQLSEELTVLVGYFQESSQLTGALDFLTEQQRQTLALAFFKGYTHSEVAEVLDLPLGSVKSNIRRSLLILKDHIEKEHGYVARSVQ